MAAIPFRRCSSTGAIIALPFPKPNCPSAYLGWASLRILVHLAAIAPKALITFYPRQRDEQQLYAEKKGPLYEEHRRTRRSVRLSKSFWVGCKGTARTKHMQEKCYEESLSSARTGAKLAGRKGLISTLQCYI